MRTRSKTSPSGGWHATGQTSSSKCIADKLDCLSRTSIFHSKGAGGIVPKGLRSESVRQCKQKYGGILNEKEPFACYAAYFKLEPWNTKGLVYWTAKDIFCTEIEGAPKCFKSTRGKCFRCRDVSYKSIQRGSDKASGAELNKQMQKCLSLKNVPGTQGAMWEPIAAVPTCALGSDDSGCQCHPQSPEHKMFTAQILIGG